MGSDQAFWDLLTPDEQRVLRSLGHGRDYQTGAILCGAGDPTTHVFVVLNGWVKVLWVTENGQEAVIALRGSGDVVGETAGETSGQRNATIQALVAVRALIVRHAKFSSFLDSHPGAGRAYRRVMTRRWSETDALLRQHMVANGAQRLAWLLLDLAERHGTRAGAVIELALPLSQEELASLAGTSRATVARALSTWRTRGLIRTRQHLITLMDVPGLRRTAGPAASV